MRSILVASIVLGGSLPAKPPKVEYDALRNVTVYSTGDVRTGGYSGMSARYEFAGHDFVSPTKVTLGFGSLRLTHGGSADHDQELLHWSSTTPVVLTFSGKTQTYPSEHGFAVSKNKMVKLLFGRALEEHLDISVSTEDFVSMTQADEIDVTLGSDHESLKGKSLEPLRQLASTIQPPP